MRDRRLTAPWWMLWRWVLVAFFAVPLAATVWQPRRLRRLIGLLAAGAGSCP